MKILKKRQLALRDYLLKIIGFNDEPFLNKYISVLEIICPKLKLLGKQKKIWNEEAQRFFPEIENKYNKYIEKEDYFVPEKFTILDFLNIEVNIKKYRDYTFKELHINFISATDISNFTYCPVSFAISKTFELPQLESATIGTSEHEKQTLINYLQPFKIINAVNKDNSLQEDKTVPNNPFLNSNTQFFFEELMKSSIVYYGHGTIENKNKYFKSVKGNFVGQPDYIFRNDSTNDIFVVEEKFQFLRTDPSKYGSSYKSAEEEERETKKRTGKVFFDNHKNQLSSYIYGIGEYEIKYGYLVYWKYEINNSGNPIIVDCKVLRIDKTESGRQELNETFIKLRELISDKRASFDIESRNPAKCASCVSNLFCGHKTGKFSEFKIPYSLEYLKLYQAEYPNILYEETNPPSTEEDP
jgi:hypothetical protein